MAWPNHFFSPPTLNSICDDGTVTGLGLSPKERDRIRLGLDDVVREFSPPLDPGLFRLDFVPVLSPSTAVEGTRGEAVVLAADAATGDEAGGGRDALGNVQQTSSIMMGTRTALGDLCVVELRATPPLRGGVRGHGSSPDAPLFFWKRQAWFKRDGSIELMAPLMLLRRAQQLENGSKASFSEAGGLASADALDNDGAVDAADLHGGHLPLRRPQELPDSMAKTDGVLATNAGKVGGNARNDERIDGRNDGRGRGGRRGRGGGRGNSTRSRAKNRQHPLYKTEMCRDFGTGRCQRGDDCRFAHSPQELRSAAAPVGEQSVNIVKTPSLTLAVGPTSSTLSTLPLPPGPPEVVELMVATPSGGGDNADNGCSLSIRYLRWWPAVGGESKDGREEKRVGSSMRSPSGERIIEGGDGGGGGIGSDGSGSGGGHTRAIDGYSVRARRCQEAGKKKGKWFQCPVTMTDASVTKLPLEMLGIKSQGMFVASVAAHNAHGWSTFSPCSKPFSNEGTGNSSTSTSSSSGGLTIPTS